MGVLKTNIQLDRYGFMIAIILFIAFLLWYDIFSLNILPQVVSSSAENYQVVWASFSFFIATTFLFASFVIHKFKKLSVAYACFLINSLITALLFLTSSVILRLIILFVAAAFFSVGQLAGFSYFWVLTTSEERGRVAGIITFFTLPLFYIVDWTAKTSDFYGAVTLGFIVGLGTLAITLFEPKQKLTLTNLKSNKHIPIDRRTVLLYTIPWALYAINNATLAKNISSHVFQVVPYSFYMVLVILQLVAAVIGALCTGIISDFFGRRFSLVFSLTSYGIASALIGITENHTLLGLAYFANGLSWGILLNTYILVIWGDLSNKDNVTKMYSIGLIIFHAATAIGILFTDQIYQVPLVIASLLSCLLIFFSNIPLILAPELLAEDFRQKIKLKLHMNTLRKIIKKSKSQG